MTNDRLSKQEYIAIAKIGGPWGLKGEAKLQAYNPESENLKKTRFVYLKAGLSFSKIKVLHCKPRGKSWGIALEGYHSPEQVKELLGQELYLKRDELVAKGQDEFYIHELLGMEVMDDKGQCLGKIHSIENYGSADLLNVKLEGLEKPKEFLIPWIKEVIGSVDQKQGRVYLNHLEGLIEAEDKS